MRVVGIQGSLFHNYNILNIFTVNAISIFKGSSGRVFIGGSGGKTPDS